MAYNHIIPMEHDEWHPQGPVHRLPKRPLGRLESQQHPPRYTPRQPVLSCHTLDIDKSGSRTYRSMSTSAIIQEQHQLLHTVYTANRSVKGVRTPRGSSKSSPSTDQKRPRFLTINGSSRPWTSMEASSSPMTSDVKKRRPKTTGCSETRTLDASTNSHIRNHKDPAIEASTQKFNSTNKRIRDLWKPENHVLDDGIFIRGKADLPSHTSSSGPSQWLNFAGGDHQAAGLVQAFTSAMKGQGDYYSIDGNVGTHVARQLRRGDKIRVGINGDVQSTDLKIKRWRKDGKWDEEGELGEDTENLSWNKPPLSWSDQVVKKDVKVLETTVSAHPKSKPNNCETHPVVFEKLISNDPVHLARDFRAFRSNDTWSSDGFAVRSRVKSRIGVDGSTPQQITSITIDTTETDSNLDDISVEDILEKRLKGSDKYSDRKQADIGISNLTDLTHHKGNSRKKTHTPPSSARSGREEVPSQPPSRMGLGSGLSFTSTDSRSVRPLTAHSANNIDQNFETFVVTSAASTSDKPTSASSVGRRAGSGKRPPPAKPSLHKSAAAMGASITSTGGGKGDAEYIKISHALSPPKKESDIAETEAEDIGIQVPTPIDNNDLSLAGDDDQELSQDDFSDLDSDLEEAVREAEANNRDLDDFEDHHQVPPPTSEPPVDIAEEIAETLDEIQARTPSRESDVRYAFNIPTADEVEEEELEEINEKTTLHDKLVEQTADLLAGAIIGADLPDHFVESSSVKRSGSRARSITFEDEMQS